MTQLPTNPRRIIAAATVLLSVFLCQNAEAGIPFSADSSPAFQSVASTASASRLLGREDPLGCVVAAARHHQVSEHTLTAIFKVESGFKANAIGFNDNGTQDIGLGQINSMHLPVLRQYGIERSDLLKPCVNTYVAAWLLRRQTAVHGNTWKAIGNYHSTTPAHNQRYQALVYNAMLDLGFLRGQRLPVPSLHEARVVAGQVASTPNSGSQRAVASRVRTNPTTRPQAEPGVPILVVDGAGALSVAFAKASP